MGTYLFGLLWKVALKAYNYKNFKIIFHLMLQVIVPVTTFKMPHVSIGDKIRQSWFRGYMSFNVSIITALKCVQ